MKTTLIMSKEALLDVGVIPVHMVLDRYGNKRVDLIWNGAGWLTLDKRPGYQWYQRCRREGVGFTEYPEVTHRLQAPMVGLLEGLLPPGWA